MAKSKPGYEDNMQPSREATNLEVLAVSKNLQAGRPVDHPKGKQEAKQELGL